MARVEAQGDGGGTVRPPGLVEEGVVAGSPVRRARGGRHRRGPAAGAIPMPEHPLSPPEHPFPVPAPPAAPGERWALDRSGPGDTSPEPAADLLAPPAPPADAPPSDPAGADLPLDAIARAAGIERIRVVAWRDLDDPEAGGSELHAHRIATLWAAAGLDVVVRTSAVPGGPAEVTRGGYRAVRRAGRYAVFPRAAWEGLRHPPGAGTALVEIWNGMPFWSPLWFRGPRLVFLHHVHAEMWRMVLPGWMARLGETVERRLAPPLYRAARVVTLSPSARLEIVEMLGLRPDRVGVVAPGVEPRFAPGPGRSSDPLVVAVGRLVPVKRFDLLIRSLVRLKAVVPALRAVIVGEGYERPALEALRDRSGARTWLSLPGHQTDDQLVDWYRRAWVLAATSQREGWGMTVTEAGACATPAVASDIAGHRDAVVDGRTGLLADGEEGMAAALGRLLTDDVLRARMGREALSRARRFRWEATARGALLALAEEAWRLDGDQGRRRAGRSPAPSVAAGPSEAVRAELERVRREGGTGGA